MAVPLEKFVQQLQASGVLAGDALQPFLPPHASPASAEELALELIRHEKLTKFQASQISRGEGKTLVLGNYLLLEKIGAGGMGQVFKARHQVMERLVAVKVLPSKMTNDQTALARFHREVKAAARLNHHNIVTAYDADHAGSVHFLVMELVEGNDLSALVKRNGPFNVNQAIDYILQAAKGLEFAHKKGVVHRDIKPSNLLLDREGTVKILDMGLARLHEDSTQAELTSTGAVMGTVDYMAPEQAVDTRSADARADVYALGCSLHFLLTGKAAYGGETMTARLLAHRDQPIPHLSNYCPNVPEQVESIFRKMVAKNVEDRYQSMTELIADLERCALDCPTPAADYERSQTAAEFTPNIPDSSAASADAMIPGDLTVNTIAVTTGHAGKPTDRRKLTLIGAAVLGAAMLVAVVVYSATRDNKPAKADHPGARNSSRPEKPATPDKDAGQAVPKPEAIAGAKKPLAFETPGFDKWLKEVSAMSPRRRLEAVSDKLKELNPGFDGRLSSPGDESKDPVIEDGEVAVDIFMRNFADLSPLRALPELRTLSCRSQYQKEPGQRLDFSPLRGMKIRRLLCGVVLIDFATVEGLPLSDLSCNGAGISDLTPVKGMPLRTLSVSGNWFIDSLEPLREMRLTYLACDNTLVHDLSPLSGMPLKNLVCHVTQVADLTPLKGMPLEELTCDQSRITDVSPLAGMRIKRLTFTLKPEPKGLDAIRQMGSLEMIGSIYPEAIPRAEFWQRYDRGEFK